MIWLAPRMEDADREAVRSYVRGLLGRAWPAGNDDSAPLDEAAAVWTEIWDRDLQRRPFPDGVPMLLGARMLWRLREPQGARRLLIWWAGEVWSAWYTPLVQRGGPCLAAGAVLGAGILQPAPSSLGPAGSAWRLDAERLRGRDGGAWELGFRVRLRRVLEECGEVWDGVSGRGLLIIDGALTGAETAYAADVLRRVRLRRGWDAAPDIVRLLRIPG